MTARNSREARDRRDRRESGEGRAPRDGREAREARGSRDKRGLRDGVSPQTDELSSALMGDALDLLAAGEKLGVLVVVQAEDGSVESFEVGDDSPEKTLAEARERVRSMARRGSEGSAADGAADGGAAGGVADGATGSAAGGATNTAANAARPVRYAIAYEGAVEAERGFGDAGANAGASAHFRDAVLLEFGERGYRSFSAYSLFEGRGEGDGFRWTDPEPAGELEPLL